MNDEKRAEGRYRRIAHNEGLRLYRSRTRTPEATEYGMYFVSENGWLISPEQGMDLDEVKNFLDAHRILEEP